MRIRIYHFSYLLLLVAMSMPSCQSQVLDFEKCHNEEYEGGIRAEDVLKVFGFVVPDSTWTVYKGSLDDLHVGATKYSDSSYSIFNATVQGYTSEWNWKEQQEIVENDFEVEASGTIVVNDEELRYNLVYNLDSVIGDNWACYFSLVDTLNKQLFTLSMFTTDTEAYQDRFCEMMPMLHSFDHIGISVEDTLKKFLVNRVVVDVPELEELPRVGSVLYNSAYQRMPLYHELVNSGSFMPSREVQVQGIKYNVAWSSDSIVRYIVTRDENFKTSAGIGLSTSLNEIKSVQEVEVFEMPGWGYYVQLKSGWSAAFCVGEFCTDETLDDDDEVDWLFKR